MSRMKPDQTKLTPTQAEALVKRYSRMRGITLDEARCQLIASGWRRLSAIWRAAEKSAGRAVPPPLPELPKAGARQ